MENIKILDLIYMDYNNQTNMNLNELHNFKKNNFSKLDDSNKKLLNKTIKLKYTPKDQWKLNYIIHALSSTKKIKMLKKIKDNMALKNLGFDTKKKNYLNSDMDN